MSKYNLKLVAKPATVKVKPKVKQKPQYDEQGLLLNPTPEQLLDMIQKSKDDFKNGHYTRVTCVADLFR